MLLVNILFVAAVGVVAAVVLFKDASWVERAGYSLFFGLTAVPFFALVLSLLTRRFIDNWMVVGVGLGLLALLAWPLVRRLKTAKWDRPGWQEGLVLGLAPVIAAGAHVYYNHSFLYLSLARFMQNRAADCFHRQAFRFVSALNPEHSQLPVDIFYAIPSAPGNSIFTTAAMQIFGMGTFHVLYSLFHVLIYLFAFLLIKRLTGRYWIALAVALFAVLNPYVMNIEVLDRNTIAYALSGVLLYTVWTRRDMPFLHGLIFGITAGAGLRMLPLTFALPVLVLYIGRRVPLRYFLLFAVAGFLTWAFNIPHLGNHGLHSLNPRGGYLESLYTAFAALPRTPFMPYPNFVFYFLKAIHALGLLGAALATAGAWYLARKDWKLLLVLALMVLPTYLVLAAQLDWIEGDKPRIFLTVWMPLMMLMGAGLALVMRKDGWRLNLATLAGAAALVFLVHLGLTHVHGQVDERTYTLSAIYQRESPALSRQLRSHFSRLPLLPDYGQLFLKLDLTRKRAEEKLVAHTLYASPSAGDPPLNPWVKRTVRPETIELPPRRTLSRTMVTLRIDPELLVGEGDAVTRVEDGGPVDIDLGNPGGLQSLYYAARKVSWQSNDLAIAVRPRAREVDLLGELHVELNGDADLGGGQVGPQCKPGMIRRPPAGQSSWPSKRPTPYALPCTREGEQATMLPGDSRAFTVRMPEDMRIVIRYLLLTGFVGDVARISSWSVDASGPGKPRVEFHFGEPEGYL